MFTRIILCLALMGSAFTLLPAQTLEWVFLDPGEGCSVQTDCTSGQQCYGLLYTPSLTGTVTSYTLGFLANCVDGGSASLSGESCTMTDNTDIQEACGFDLIQILPSGNSGALSITASIPVVLHQVCVTLQAGSSMTFNEDENLALTVSVDLTDGGAQTDNLTYNTFTASVGDCGGTLPVTWESFTVSARAKSAWLEWSTSAEVNHDYFTVEWGTDGQYFSPVATVREAESGRAGVRQFSYEHLSPVNGINYYRIRQTDFSGEYSFSAVRSLEFSGAGESEDFTIYPNPAGQQVVVAFSSAASASPIRITNLSGKLLRTVPRQQDARVRLDIGGLPPGIYLVQAEGHTQRLIKL